MNLSTNFSEDLKVFLAKIEKSHFELCLVGGAVRDYFLKGIINKDLDFEIRQKKTYLSDGHLLQDLIILLEKENIEYELLPYSIIKFSFGEYDLEFSPPRIEHFKNNSNSHHNFFANLDFNLNYYDSFLRRDFTINSIGVELKTLNSDFQESLIDPYNGISDLQNNLLRSTNPNFYKDPVRFLRLIRFSIKLDLKIDQEIIDNLFKFDLSEMSYFHFWREVFKADAGKFLNLFYNLTNKHNIKLEGKLINSLLSMYPEKEIESFQDLVAYTFFRDPKKARNLTSILSIRDKFVDDLELYDGHYSYLINEFPVIKDHNPQDFFSNQQTLSYLKSLKFVDQHRELENYLRFSVSMHSSLPFDLTSLADIRIDKSTIELFSPELRSYVKYEKFLKNILG